MNVDENVFFREATLRICSSLNIVEALKSCFGYIKPYVPTNRIFFHIFNADLNLTRIVASVGDDMMEESERILYYPEKGRNERAAMLKADLLKNEVVIRIWNQPDQMEGLPEILERLGLKAKTSLMNMLLKLVEGNQIASLALFANGLNQYTAEHARLLKLLHEPFAISISNALRHQEAIRLKDERMSHLRFFQNMDRINRAMQGANDLEQIMNDALDAMLSIFDSDRAYLLYPCDPDAPSFVAVMERTRPEYPGRRGVITMSPDSAMNFQLTLASSGAVTFGPEADFGARFGQKSQITIALYPKTGKPWLLGMHQCSYPRVWTPDEKKLLEEIARRMGDVLTSLLAHRDLLESGERYRVILQTAMDGFFRADMQGRILEVNETYCRMSGYSEQELLALTIADIEAVYNAEMIAVKIRGLAERGPKRFESAHRRKDGGLFDVEISGQYQPIAGGQVVVFVRDITERKRAEKALQRSEAYLAEAQRLSHTGSWAFNVADDKYVYLSEECFRIFELDAQQGVPSREASTRYVHPKDWDKVEGTFEKSLREKVDTSVEYRIVMPDGSVKHIHAIGRPVLDEAGKVVEYVGTAMDITERKRAEEALRLAGIYNRSLIEASLDPLVTINPEGRITDVNAATEQVTGYTRSELIGTDFSDYFTDPEKARSGYRQVFSEGLVRDYELNIRHRDGKITPVLYNASVYRDEADKVIGVFAAARDITERKRAEEALRRSQTYLAEAQRLSHTGSWAFDVADGKYIYLSDECFRIFEMDAQEGLPNREAISRLIHPEDWDRVNEDFEELLRKKVDTSSEFRLVLPSGTRKHTQVIRHPVLNAAGDVVTILGTAIDITERKRAEAEINSLKNYLSNIIDSMPSILVGMDNARTVTQWNSQAEAFTGIPAGEAIGKPILDVLPDFSTWITIMRADMDENRPSSLEKLLLEKEGERRFYDLMLYPLIVDSVGGAVLRIEDVTERARIQELMVQTEKMMSIGGLAAGMSHEINNPLGIITQAAQNIERRISLELPANRKVAEELGLNLEGIRAYFEKRQIFDAIASIRSASSRAAKIVSNMLQFSRRADTTMESTSLAQIVDQALELAASDYDLKKNYDFRSIDIIKEYQDTPEVRIVSVEIEQVILNLLKNAAQAMIANPPDRKPRITFRLYREDRYAVLEVEDNGPGMTEDIVVRVFEPFFTTKEPGVGTGLGLSVSYMVVTQNHKGFMRVHSTPGRGTLFQVRLPIEGSKYEPVGKSIDCGR